MFVTDLYTGETIKIINTMDKKREGKLSTVPFCIEEQQFHTKRTLAESKAKTLLSLSCVSQ